MSQVLALNAKLLRAARLDLEKYEPTRDGRPRNQWAVLTLYRAGLASPAQMDAGLRLCKLLERREGVVSAGGAQKVDSGLKDPHAPMWDRAVCSAMAENALHAVRRRLTSNRSRAIFSRAFDFPLRTITQLEGQTMDKTGPVLVTALEWLTQHFEGVDADRANHLRHAVDTITASA
jgi:hypothetical protein